MNSFESRVKLWHPQCSGLPFTGFSSAQNPSDGQKYYLRCGFPRATDHPLAMKKNGPTHLEWMRSAATSAQRAQKRLSQSNRTIQDFTKAFLSPSEYCRWSLPALPGDRNSDGRLHFLCAMWLCSIGQEISCAFVSTLSLGLCAHASLKTRLESSVPLGYSKRERFLGQISSHLHLCLPRPGAIVAVPLGRGAVKSYVRESVRRLGSSSDNQ